KTPTLMPYTTLFRSIRSCEIYRPLERGRVDDMQNPTDHIRDMDPAPPLASIAYIAAQAEAKRRQHFGQRAAGGAQNQAEARVHRDRKSTRLNSSHSQ